MKGIIFLSIFIFFFINFQIDKSDYYNVLSGNSVEELNLMIQKIEKEPANSLTKAYKGTLIAKKSSYIKSAAEKIKIFKKGIKLLEAEIYKFPQKVEYRFLRLTIQENCPKVLKYNKNIDADIKMIIKEYPLLEKELKDAIVQYAKTSMALKSSSLK